MPKTDAPSLEPLVGASLLAADSSDTSELARGDYFVVWDKVDQDDAGAAKDGGGATGMKRVTVQELGEAYGKVFT